jgi:hypothetical protein
MFFADFELCSNFGLLRGLLIVMKSFFKLFWVDDKDLLLLLSLNPLFKVLERDFDFLFYSSSFCRGLKMR